MNIELSRRQFLAGASAGIAGTTLGALGFGDIETAYAAAIRPFKLAGTTETRNTCPYCSVACGIIMYSKGSLSKREKADIVHIEGDSDHLVCCRHLDVQLGLYRFPQDFHVPMLNMPAVATQVHRNSVRTGHFADCSCSNGVRLVRAPGFTHCRDVIDVNGQKRHEYLPIIAFHRIRTISKNMPKLSRNKLILLPSA